jgi:predicted metal-dependent phosphoesterase TrpH
MVNFPLYGRADLQVHSSFGDGMDSAKTIFDSTERSGFLNVIAITDHDDIRGAVEAREVHARGNYSFDFVTGTEITTLSGHILALWIDEPVPSFKPLHRTIELVHELGGIVIIPHPFSHLTRSVGYRSLDKLMRRADEIYRPDAIEVGNPTSTHRFSGFHSGRRVTRLNRERWNLAETGGSDAHFKEAIGSGYTLFCGQTDNSLRRAISSHSTIGLIDTEFSFLEIGLGRLVAQQGRGLTVTPKKVATNIIRRFRGSEF